MDREKKREYCRKWRVEHKEHLKEYYEKNKDSIMEMQRRYRKKNLKKIAKMCHDYRKRKAEEFKAQGQMYCYYPKTERQNKMVTKLCNKTGLNEQESRKLLEDNNWNIKSLLPPKKVRRSKVGRPRKNEVA